jgi:exopolysaccharide biosynthesis protein
VRLGHCSRSAVGLTKNGDILLVAVETPGVGRGGLYLDEMAAIMRKLGAYQAMNWDGGGSTTVVQGDQIINRVAGDPRPVSTGLIVVPRPTVLASK